MTGSWARPMSQAAVASLPAAAPPAPPPVSIRITSRSPSVPARASPSRSQVLSGAARSPSARTRLMLSLRDLRHCRSLACDCRHRGDLYRSHLPGGHSRPQPEERRGSAFGSTRHHEERSTRRHRDHPRVPLPDGVRAAADSADLRQPGKPRRHRRTRGPQSAGLAAAKLLPRHADDSDGVRNAEYRCYFGSRAGHRPRRLHDRSQPRATGRGV